MRLDEIAPPDEGPLSSQVNSLLLRLDASNIKKIKFETFVNELNNIMNITIDLQSKEQATNIKSLISNSGKADINGDYIIMDYSAPKDSTESKVEKIAMKNIRDR